VPVRQDGLQVIGKSGATRRDRTGDLLITNFHLSPYAIHSKVGLRVILLAYSAWWALIEPDFEPNYSILTRHARELDCAAHECADVISTAMGDLNSQPLAS
jgi:hypothetical protein